LPRHRRLGLPDAALTFVLPPPQRQHERRREVDVREALNPVWQILELLRDGTAVNSDAAEQLLEVVRTYLK
jgi:hypothetical protein